MLQYTSAWMTDNVSNNAAHQQPVTGNRAVHRQHQREDKTCNDRTEREPRRRALNERFVRAVEEPLRSKDLQRLVLNRSSRLETQMIRVLSACMQPETGFRSARVAVKSCRSTSFSPMLCSANESRYLFSAYHCARIVGWFPCFGCLAFLSISSPWRT